MPFQKPAEQGKMILWIVKMKALSSLDNDGCTATTGAFVDPVLNQKSLPFTLEFVLSSAGASEWM